MEPTKISDDLYRRLKQAQLAIERELPRRISKQACELFENNFRLGGFLSGGLSKWPDVKRRDKDSKWYGFEYRGQRRTSYAFARDSKTGKTYKSEQQEQLNYSETATRRAVLTSKRNYLMGSLSPTPGKGYGAVATDAPHAQIHNEGGEFKVFGKHSTQMPKRQFMGPSPELNDKVEQEINQIFDRIFN